MHNWEEINTVEEFEKFRTNSVVIFVCGDKTIKNMNTVFNTISKYANIYLNLKLGWTNNEEVKHSLKCPKYKNHPNHPNHPNPYSIFLFKPTDEEIVEYNNTFNEDMLDSWMSIYYPPCVRDLTNQEVQSMYRDRKYKYALIYLYSHESIYQADKIKELEETYKQFYSLALKYRVISIILTNKT